MESKAHCKHIIHPYGLPGFIIMLLTLLLFISGCGSSGTSNPSPASNSNSGATSNPSQGSSPVSTGRAINLVDYATVAISGESGQGKATYSFDYGKFEDMLAQRLEADKDSAQFFSDATIIEEGIRISLDKTSGLSNGDNVVLTVSYNNEAAKKYNLAFQGGSATHSVSDLIEIAEFTVDEQDVIALLLETTVNHNMQDITVLPENITGFSIVDSQNGISPDTARLNFAYGLDCKIAVLSITGSVEYKYENDAWVNTRIMSTVSQGTTYKLPGVYTGFELDIAGDGIPCNARYEITETSEGVYEAKATWSAGEESPDMAEKTATLPLSVDFTTQRFIIPGNEAALTAAVGRTPYLARALKFDYANGGFSANKGFTSEKEIDLLKISD